eukprot:606581-Amphidinium_carterae.1
MGRSLETAQWIRAATLFSSKWLVETAGLHHPARDGGQLLSIFTDIAVSTNLNITDKKVLKSTKAKLDPRLKAGDASEVKRQ